MKACHSLIRLVASALLLSGCCASETTKITGCLTKDTGGSYALTDDKSGVTTIIIFRGLHKHTPHPTNHRVTLTGPSKTETNGRSVFEVSTIQHVSVACKIGSK